MEVNFVIDVFQIKNRVEINKMYTMFCPVFVQMKKFIVSVLYC